MLSCQHYAEIQSQLEESKDRLKILELELHNLRNTNLVIFMKL